MIVHMEELKEFKNEYGHLNVPKCYGSLGGFAAHRREYYKLLRAGKPALGMTQERANKLQALGFKLSINC